MVLWAGSVNMALEPMPGAISIGGTAVGTTHSRQLVQGCLKVVDLDVEGHVAAGGHVLGGAKDAAAYAALIALHQAVVAHLLALHLHLPAEEVLIEFL